MKKTVKILAIVLLSIMMLFVTVQPVSYARDASEIINEATKEPTDKKADTSGLNNVAQNVINIIWIISIIVAIVVVMVIGIQFIVGGTQQKAEYKKALMPVAVGVGLVVFGTSIVKFLFSMNG
ncbi:MAG: TrbC/VirB2 family protein [Clostridia bacterium]|nr:TrbC/VirB2 family protein [Clostridia bacterium]